VQGEGCLRGILTTLLSKGLGSPSVPGVLMQRHPRACPPTFFCGSTSTKHTHAQQKHIHTHTSPTRPTRFITHTKRLSDGKRGEGSLRKGLANFMAQGVLLLGEQLGPILWQVRRSYVTGVCKGWVTGHAQQLRCV